MAATRIGVFEQMLESDPENTMVLFGLANEYQKAGQYQDVIRSLIDYLQRADDEGAAYGMLARAYEKVGDRVAARQAFERGITVALEHSHPSMAEDYRLTLATDYED